MFDRPYNLPAHATRRRYRVVGCRCVGCTRGDATTPTELRWPFRWLDRRFGKQLNDWYTEAEIAAWKANGLGDYEADEVCVKLGVLPHEVFPGYMEAGLDAGTYP